MKPPSARPWRNPANRCVVSSGDLALRNPITGIAGCCARAASGHAATVPPRSVMNWRRRISALQSSGDSIVSAQTEADIAALFNYVVGNSHYARWNGDAKCLSGLEVDHKLELSRLHNRQIGSLLTFENSPDVDTYLAIRVRYPVAVSHQTANLSEFW